MKDEPVRIEQLGAFVPFPAALLDEQMPRLKDTEWRLLCVIVRQTLGWQSGKGRKRRDWMTQKQLMKRTGRASAALSAALDVLSRENLVECHGTNGEVLLSAQHRRKQRGRVYFSLAPRLLQPPTKTVTSQKIHVAATELSRESTLRVFNGWAKAGIVAVERYPSRSVKDGST